MSSVLARILLRYGAGAVLGSALLHRFGLDPSALANDPDVQLLVAAGIAGVAEAWTWLAHKFGWPT